MGRKRASNHDSKPNAGTPPPSVMADPTLALPDSRAWIQRFLLIVLLVFFSLALLLSAYNLYMGSQSTKAEAAISTGGLDGYAQAVSTLSSPHLFAGYEPYHGFGRESATAWLEKTQQILESGRDYTPEELGFLIHRADFYLAAFPEVRTADNPPVAGDATVLNSLLQRNTHAIGNAWVAVAYLLTVTAILFVPWILYRRKARS